MIVYVETNFILELAFEQDQHQEAIVCYTYLNRY